MSSSDLIPNPEIHTLEVATSTEGEDETCVTYVMHHEDHTIGNSLRYMILKNPEVEYCGYSVPHPSEEKINLRIQTSSKPAVEVLKTGLVNLQKVSLHALDTFQEAVMNFKQNRKENNEQGDVEMDSD
uniref:DNA-directed RNA polymerases I and III subunit RPAC2 n=1 Tax=Clytia hemisphaerica TaxID=252671 RepID=A0A7M5UVF2_9CNID|eukprot:TCONS_00062807-protein